MSLICDFCTRPLRRHGNEIFVESPSKLVHVCGHCITKAAKSLAARQKEQQDSCMLDAAQMTITPESGDTSA